MKIMHIAPRAVSKGQIGIRSNVNPKHSTVCLGLLIILISLQTATQATGGTLYWTARDGCCVYGATVVCGYCEYYPVEFCYPVSALAVDSQDGTVYAATPGGITKNTYSGNTLLVNGIQGCTGLRTDQAGNLYALTSGGLVHKITPATNVSVFAELPGVGDLVIDQTGTIYTANGTNVSKTVPGGNTFPFAHLVGSARTMGLAFDRQGNLFVVTSVGIERIAPDGTGSMEFRWADVPWDQRPFNNTWAHFPDSKISIDELDNVYLNFVYAGSMFNMSVMCKYSPGTNGGSWTTVGSGLADSTDMAYSPLVPVPSILILPPGAAGPTITAGPQPKTVKARDAASFSVTAIGVPLAYQWALNGTNIAGATASSLTISNVTPVDLGVYTVAVSNSLGIATSNAVLSMYPYLSVPFSGVVAYWGKDAILSVQAWGTGPLSYQWFKDGVAVPDATNEALTMPSIQFTNAGLYWVVVSSALGSVTNAPAQVVVNPAGVSLGFSPTVTIDGVVGYSYIVERTTDLTNTNSWVALTNLTLTQPVQLWPDTSVDASSPFNSKYFYRVLPGQ